MIYRIQQNLFGGCELYGEDEDGLHYLATYTSEQAAERARLALEYKRQQATAQINLKLNPERAGRSENNE